MKLVVAGADNGGSQHRLAPAIALQPAADVHGDIGDLVVADAQFQLFAYFTGDGHRHLKDHGVGRFQRSGQRVPGPGLLPGPMHQILHMQAQAPEEVSMDDVHQVFMGCVLDGAADH